MAKHGKLRISDPRVAEALAEMGVGKEDLDCLKQAKTQAEGEKKLDELKAVVKKGFRKKARELHPDVTGNDPEKTDRFKFLKSIYEGFMGAKFVFRASTFRVKPAYPSVSTGDPFLDMFIRKKKKAQARRPGHMTLEELLRQIGMENFGGGFATAPRMDWEKEAREQAQRTTERWKKEDQDREAIDRAARRKAKAEHMRAVEEMQRQAEARSQQFRGSMRLDEDVFYQDLHHLAEEEIMDQEPMSASEIADDWMGRDGGRDG